MDREELNGYRKNYARLVAACWQDEDVKKKFLESAEELLKDYSVPVEESKQYLVIVADKFSAYVILPYEGVEEAAQTLFRMLHTWSDKEKQIIKPGCELRIIQKTADTNYLGLPFCPELYTEEEKMSLQKADGCVTMDVDVVAQLELAVYLAVAQTIAEATTAIVTAEVLVLGVIVLI